MLRSRRRIGSQPPGWALSPNGLRTLRQVWPAASLRADGPAASVAATADPASVQGGEGEDASAQNSRPFDAELAAIDALLARSDAVIEEAGRTDPAKSARTEKDLLAYDFDWDEDERSKEWRGVVRQVANLPPVLQAIVALDAWNELAVLQHASRLGRLLAAASILRQAALTTAPHLAAVNLGLKSIAVDRRRHRDRQTWLLAIAQRLTAAAELGLKEHDRLALARQMMERKLTGRGTSSKLPELIHGKNAGLGGYGCEDARAHAAGGEADCWRARSAGGDGEGEVSGVGSGLGRSLTRRLSPQLI